MIGSQRDSDDRTLADAVGRRGDEVAFRKLYARHTPALLGFVYRLLGSEAKEAEDVVQETWIRACTGLHGFRWESSFLSWLRGIGLNVVREHLQQKVRSRLAREDSPPDPPTPPGSVETRFDLQRCVRQLPDGYRVVLVLHDVEGMKHREIAARLGISVGTSKSQLYHARKTLRAMLAESGEVAHG